MKYLTGTRPDITPAQVAALLTFVVGQAVAWGLMDTSRAQSVVAIGSVVIAAVWKLADAYLRGQRNHAPAAPPVKPAAK